LRSLLRAHLLHEARGGGRKDRALTLPVGEALAIDAQRLVTRGRLRVVETETFDEAAVTRAARIGDHDVEERALLGAAAG